MIDQLRLLRDQIDALDASIVKLLKERVEVSRKIGTTKKKLKISVCDPVREDEVLSHVEKLGSKLDMKKEDLREAYKKILSMSRAVQGRQDRVAFLGPSGTFCEQASRHHFKNSSTFFVEHPTITDVFRAVGVGEVDYGVVPVENSTEGSVNVALDMLFNSDLKVCGEIEQRIRHNLIAKPGTKWNSIRTVVSHPQALAQCRKFLEENIPDAKLNQVSSTSAAIRMAKRLRNTVAIGTELAAEINGMEIIARGIEDNPRNFTRFFVIGRHDAPPSGNDKTSIVFSVRHVPGALFNAIQRFSERGLNLTKIESRPTRDVPWEYVFYCDFEGHRNEEKCLTALKELEAKCQFVKVLGSYPRAR
jgi:chorismate mutase/prephenate dehydratase